MKLDFSTFAFGYHIKVGGGTPNWATALGQGKEYKINNNPEINEIIKGMIYSSIQLSKVSTKIGKGGKLINGNIENSPIILAALFDEVYINDKKIIDGKFILLITRDNSASHTGRLRLKYGPSNKYGEYSNEQFFKQVHEQLNLHEEACWFVYDISIIDQNKLILKTIIVNPEHNVEYENTKEHHAEWNKIISKSINNNVSNLMIGENIIFYGVPGCGKSYLVNKKCGDLDYTERVVFHPDYTNSDFIGQIMPILNEYKENNIKKKNLEYVFIPGPFSNILKKAIENPQNMYYLIIEEINRGNSAAIFGDIFQLLDRNEYGISKYSINNYYIADYIYNNKTKKIQLPSNLTIYATMNSSDQNVFSLDTAFQRRWIMKNVPNNFQEKQSTYFIDKSNITWGAFATIVNETLLDNNMNLISNEDKGLGVYFVSKSEIEDIQQFSQKVFKYLWDDAFKLNRYSLFNNNLKTLSSILDICNQEDNNPLEKILIEDIYKKMLIKNNEFINL